MAYDGSSFHGFASNPGVATIQQALEETIGQVLRHPVKLSAAGRTDAGVHSRGQVISFDADAAHFEPLALSRALNRLLAPFVSVDKMEVAGPSFDARHSCVARSYRYQIFNRKVNDPLVRHFSWHVRERLDLSAMQEVAAQIVGTHDFTSFSKRNKSRPSQSFVRNVSFARWRRRSGLTTFDITANSFVHQLVRSLVGICVAVGLGQRNLEDFQKVLQALDRKDAPSPAPSHGLIFMKAHYDDQPQNDRNQSDPA